MATKSTGPVRPPADGIQESADRQLDLARNQFAQSRRRTGGVFREAGRKSKQGFDRLRALTGQTGGSMQKARQKSLSEIARQKGETEAGMSAQQAALERGIEQEAGAKRFAREERTGSQEFAASESRLAREQQADQFTRTLDFQGTQLAEMARQFDVEFTENQRTNMLNTAMALKDAGIKSPRDWAKLSDAMSALFGDQFAGVKSMVNQFEKDRREAEDMARRAKLKVAMGIA